MHVYERAPINNKTLEVEWKEIKLISYLRENVPQISRPFPFSAGSQLTLGATYIEEAAVKPKMSPSKPVVV